MCYTRWGQMFKSYLQLIAYVNIYSVNNQPCIQVSIACM